MEFSVEVTEDAERDLEAIFDYVASHRSLEVAERLITEIEEVIQSLRQHPNRGRRPVELVEQGLSEHREVVKGRFRIIYRVSGDTVHVSVVADGRRNMRDLLFQRLILA